VQSPFPPLPPVSEANVCDLMFGRPDQESIQRCKFRFCANWPDYAIHIEENTGRKRTYKQLVKRVTLGATALGAPVSSGGLGLSGDGGEIIGLLGDNSLDYIDITVSLLAITIPFALISTHSTCFELVHALKLTKATRLFVDARLLRNVLAAIEDPDVHLTQDKIYVLSGQPADGRQSFGQLIDTVAGKNVPLEPVRRATKDTLAYLIMSSGTSGLPKAVMVTHGNVVCTFYQGMVLGQAMQPFLTPLPSGTMPVTIGVLPMFHTYGLHAYILRMTFFQATYIILDKWNTTKYLNSVTKYRATHLTLIPSAIHQLVNHPDIATADLSSVVAVTSGAAYLPPELASQLGRFLEKNPEIAQGYGLSECTISALVPPIEGMLNMGAPPPKTTGILTPGVEGRIVREDGADAASGEVGELWLRGGNICPGYWNNPEANAGTFVDGWLRTGDQFTVDDKGYFFFADRGKDTLKLSGVQVSPKEIEDALFAHPEKLISDVAVAGVSRGRTEDEKVPRAWIVLSSAGEKKGASAVIKALEQWHHESLSKYKWLRGGIEVVKEVPKTPTGKTMRRVLQDEYEREAKKIGAKL
ncbi:hypothetical protein DFH07DRAFT_1021402, partial [Mycena maculata]